MKQPSQMTYDELTNTIRGMNLVAQVPKEYIDALFVFLDAIEQALEEASYDDYWGTEGWRHGILGEDA